MENENLKCKKCRGDKFDLSENDGLHVLTCRNCGEKTTGCMLKCNPCGRLVWLPGRPINETLALELKCEQCSNDFEKAKDLIVIKKMPRNRQIVEHKAMHY